MVLPTWFCDRLRHGPPLLLDGATGTELERRGVATPPPLWSAAALLDHPDVVARIHADYVAAGADILVANTFRTGPRALRCAGIDTRGPELNRLAVTLAREAAANARHRPVLVAASVAPVEDCYQPEHAPDEPTLAREHDRLIQWLAPASPDLIWIETIGTIREARAATAAARAAGFPFVISLVLRETGALLSGEPLHAAVAAIEPQEPLAIGLNCIPPGGLSALLPRLRATTRRPLVAYAHINNARPIPGWRSTEHLTPARYAAIASGWVDLGARIVGGCCGTTPSHIAALRKRWGRPGRDQS